MFSLNSHHSPDSLLLDAYRPALLGQDMNLFTLTIKHNPKTSLARYQSHAVLSAPCKDEFPVDAYHLLGGMVREALLKQGIYSVHSTCVDGHLIVAHSGGGKSSVLLECVEQGMKEVISGNKTLVTFMDGKMQAVGGTASMTIGEQVFHEQVQAPVSDKKVYGDRVAFRISEDRYASHPQNIHAVWVVKLTNEDVVCQELSKMSVLHRLFPFFMDTVNASVILGEGEVLFQPEDQKAEEGLPALLKQVLDHVQVFEVSGTRQEIAKLIKEKTS
ncbi:MAG: hypothetical protein VX730_00395 [Pseudomonadota bacterium]|nr:hypothetical protein [Pseudomonadota bacterium]